MSNILFQFSFLVALVLFNGTNGQNLETWRYSMTLDTAGKYNLTVTVDLVTKWINFTASVETSGLGWIGIGISPNPNMVGADIFVGGASENEIIYQNDHHSQNNTRPTVDTVGGDSDWEVFSGELIGNNMVFKIYRSFGVTDTTQDREIKNENVYLIWAYGKWNGSVTTHSINDALKHEATARGSRLVNLLQPPSSTSTGGGSSLRINNFSTFFSITVVTWLLIHFV